MAPRSPTALADGYRCDYATVIPLFFHPSGRYVESIRSPAPLPEGDAVKLIIAIIQPTKLSAVREALEKIEVRRLTVCDAQGFGRQRGRTEMFRGHEYSTTLLRKVALEIIVNDDFLDRTIETIINTARTGPEGTIGDGKIFVLPAEQAIQINDGAHGPGAV
jgi:nitrogen regulatory protein P-II 1